MRTNIQVVLAAAMASASGVVLAQPMVAEDELTIEAMFRGGALPQLRQQTRTHVLSLGAIDDLKDAASQRIRGPYTISSAAEDVSTGPGSSFSRSDAVVAAGPSDGERTYIERFAATDGEVTPGETPARSNTGASSATQRRRDASDMEEVIVTAQKRSERLDDVPIAISVLGGDALESAGLSSATDALSLIPGAKTTVGFQGGGTQVSLRGVAASGPLFNGSSTIGYYMDSAPFGLVKTAVVPDSNVYDLERVEVLRGPQGTLYGASALNGVVRILTNPAKLDALEFKVRTSASSTHEGGESYRGDMAVNVPLIDDKLAARVVVGYEDVGGWIDRPNARDANDGQIKNARLKINAQLTDNLSAGLSGWVSRADFDAPAIGLDDNTTPSRVDQPQTTDFDIYGLTLGYNLLALSISSATTYIDYQNTSKIDLAPLVGAPFFFETDFDAHAFSEEFIVNSTSTGDWRWSAGAFYRDAEDSVFQPGFPANTDFTDSSESFAIFGEMTRKLADGRLELTGGLRYFEDKVTQQENVRHTGIPTEPLYERSHTFDAVSPRFVATWFATENLTVYGSYSEGFRSGFNQNAIVANIAPNFPPLNEDTLRNYEVGAKGNLLDGRLHLDSAVYFIDWQDVQQSVFVEVRPGVATAALINGESASGFGIDLAVTTRPVEGLTLGITGSWNDLTLDGEVLSAGVVLFEKGDRLNVSAEYTYGALAEYALEVGGYETRFSVSGNYTSEQTSRTLSGGVPFLTVSDDQLFVQASLSLRSDRNWTATLFGDNLNNEGGSPSRYLADFLDSRVRPRTVGLQLEYHF